MIESTINTPIALTANDSSVVFQNDSIRTRSTCGCDSWLCHQDGSANYTITKPGLFDVDFHASVSSATAGVVAFALFNNGEMIPGTLMAETLAAANDYANIGISTTVRGCCNASSNISVRSVPAVPTPATPATPIETQVPIIVSGTLNIDPDK